MLQGTSATQVSYLKNLIKDLFSKIGNDKALIEKILSNTAVKQLSSNSISFSLDDKCEVNFYLPEGLNGKLFQLQKFDNSDLKINLIVDELNGILTLNNKNSYNIQGKKKLRKFMDCL